MNKLIHPVTRTGVAAALLEVDRVCAPRDDFTQLVFQLPDPLDYPIVPIVSSGPGAPKMQFREKGRSPKSRQSLPPRNLK